MKVLVICLIALIHFCPASAASSAEEPASRDPLVAPTGEHCDENESSFSVSSSAVKPSAPAVVPRHLQAWRSRGGVNTGGYASGYTTGYSSPASSSYSSPTYAMRTGSSSSSYTPTYSGSTTYGRAMPTYSTGVTYPSTTSSSGTTYYSSGSSGGSYSGTTYTGSSGGPYAGTAYSSGTPYTGSVYTTGGGTPYSGSSGSTYSANTIGSPTTYTQYSGGTRMGSSSSYMDSSGSSYISASSGQPTYSSGAYTQSSQPYAGGSAPATGGAYSSSVVGGPRTFMTSSSTGSRSAYHSTSGGIRGYPGSRTNANATMSPVYSSIGSSGSTIASPTGSQTYSTTGVEGGSGALRSRSGIPTAGSSFSSGVHSAAPVTPGLHAGTTGAVGMPIGMSTASSSSNTHLPLGAVPPSDPTRARGNSSFRAFGGASEDDPLPAGEDGSTIYYLREADGSLTPLEPPPYDQMKPDSYYTDLYLTDRPIRFENQVRRGISPPAPPTAQVVNPTR